MASICYVLQFWQETDKAAYLVRQYFFNNLHDRLSTRPFLSLIEKKWLAFQVLSLFDPLALSLVSLNFVPLGNLCSVGCAVTSGCETVP